jgi:hypothetical protein
MKSSSGGFSGEGCRDDDYIVMMMYSAENAKKAQVLDISSHVEIVNRVHSWDS